MGQFKIPDSVDLYTTKYDNLKGVDYSKDITEVDRTRTPSGVNMISDDGGNPVKRRGWRVTADVNCGKIFEIIFHEDDETTYDPLKKYVIGQTGIYAVVTRAGTQSIVTMLTATITKTEYFMFGGKAYCFINGGMYNLHGVTAELVDANNAYVPEVTISLNPDGSSGSTLESVNMLSTKKKFSFLGDTTSTNFYLYPASVRDEDAYKYVVKDTIKVEQATSSGWTELTLGTDYTLETGTTVNGLNAQGVVTSYTVCAGHITFPSAKPPLVAGQDNIRVTFEAFDNATSTTPATYTATATASRGTATVTSNANYQSFFPACDGKTAVFTYQVHGEGNYWNTPLHSGKWISNWGSNTGISYSGTPQLGDTVTVVSTVDTYAKNGLYKADRLDLMDTTACLTYGYTAVDRVFAVGGKNKNRVYYSQVNEPLYFPDDNYLTVGHDSNGIVGLHRISEYLAAVKEDSAIEGTVFLISGAYLDDKMYFKVTATSAGTGAISQKTFSTLVDEPLFLSRDGVYGVANYYTTTEKVIRNRSYLLDRKLLKESNLQNACAITWKRYYILCVNSHCYVLDGRNKTADNNNNTDYLYEAYYWENVPAVTFSTYQNELWFGDSNGHLCKFNTDVEGRTKYCDNGTENVTGGGSIYLTGGDAITCEWSTPLDDDKKPQYFKTLNKRGSLLTLLPYERTSAKVTLIKDGETETALSAFYADIQNWNVVDFERFTFSSNDTAQDDFFRKKVKKYKRLQIVVKNDAIYEPFGILGITKTYSYNNYAK